MYTWFTVCIRGRESKLFCTFTHLSDERCVGERGSDVLGSVELPVAVDFWKETDLAHARFPGVGRRSG